MEHYECQISNKPNVWQSFQPLPAYVFLVCDILRCALIKKVYSINIVYFGLGQGKDYIYEYDGKFVGIHNGDILSPTNSQKEAFKINEVKDIFPKYYILKVNNFDGVAKNTLDEWIYFLKNSEIKDSFHAKGLKEAEEKLRVETLTEEEKWAYNRFQDNRRIELSVTQTALMEGEEKGMEKGMEIVIKAYQMYKSDKAVAEIADAIHLTVPEVEEIIKNFD